MAVNCWCSPKLTGGLPGVTWMETKTGAVTVSSVPPDTAPMAAEIVVVPIPAVLARPCEPAALLTVATPVAVEAQVDMALTS